MRWARARRVPAPRRAPARDAPERLLGRPRAPRRLRRASPSPARDPHREATPRGLPGRLRRPLGARFGPELELPRHRRRRHGGARRGAALGGRRNARAGQQRTGGAPEDARRAGRRDARAADGPLRPRLRGQPSGGAHRVSGWGTRFSGRWSGCASTGSAPRWTPHRRRRGPTVWSVRLETQVEGPLPVYAARWAECAGDTAGASALRSMERPWKQARSPRRRGSPPGTARGTAATCRCRASTANHSAPVK